MAEVVARSSEPTLAAIKLAWWRERLEELDEGKVPAEPRLRAAAKELLPRGVSGADLATLGENWWLLLQTHNQPTFMRGVAGRGPSIFALAARLLGVPIDEHLGDAPQSFAAADLGRRRIWDLVPLKFDRWRDRVPRRLRPLTAFAVLARRDMRSGPPFEAEATPLRAWALFWHRLTGFVP